MTSYVVFVTVGSLDEWLSNTYGYDGYEKLLMRRSGSGCTRSKTNIQTLDIKVTYILPIGRSCYSSEI